MTATTAKRGPKAPPRKPQGGTSVASLLVYRQVAEDDKRIDTIPWAEWEAFAAGKATPYDWFNIMLRLRLHNEVVAEYYTQESVEQVNECIMVMAEIGRHADHSGKWQATPEQVTMIRAGLTACVETHEGVSRKQRAEAFGRVLLELSK